MHTDILKLKNKVKRIFKKYHLSEKDSKICADAIIYAELVGAQSHGLVRVKMYCDRIKKKIINPNPKFKIKNISNSISLLDADNSIGFVSADKGIKIAIKNASITGLGLVGIKNSNHYGLSRFYAEKATKKNFLSLCFTISWMAQKT